MNMEMVNALGRRKRSIARVYVTQGSGKVIVNGKDYKEYFPQGYINVNVVAPFGVAEIENIYDIKVNVKGGGFKGQAEAIKLGIARALVKINAELKSPLKAAKMMTRDSRVVERKKYGKPKARKSFQFSKR